MAGAQAADLPVKAKPVQYVKICSLYGAGFYYIPGTDTCIKLGGWVRLYTLWGANGDSTNGALGSYVKNDRTTNNFSWKTRGYITADVRNQSEYGTIRAYMDVGFSGDFGNVFSSNRAFIQFAGFTWGLSQSFYDFYSQPAVSHFGGHVTPASDTGDAGQWLMGYTAQFGNGMSGSISAEAPSPNRRTFIWNTNTTSAGQTAATGSSYEGVQWPDFVANLRVDQAWGAAQIMGAVHDASGTYYNSASGSAGFGPNHPSNAVGWAVGAGLKLLAPMIGQGDYFQAQVNYTNGATGYVAAGNISYAGFQSGPFPGNTYGYGLQADGVYGSTGDVELTTAWGVDASYEHRWNQQWKTSVYGSYVSFSYNDRANALACSATTFLPSFYRSPSHGCDNDYSYWDIGSRTQFNLDANTYLSLDVVYTHLNTASGGTFANTPSGYPSGTLKVDDQSAWIAHFRVHRDFYP